MVQHSFDIGRGVYGFAPAPNHKKLSKSEYNNQLVGNILKHSNMSVTEFKKYMGWK